MLYRFFFFQAEDGIRDGHVTGVQTCALPILPLLLAIREDEYMKQSVVSVVHNKPDDIRLELRQKKLDVIIGSPENLEYKFRKLKGFIKYTQDNNTIEEDRKSTRLNSSHVAISYAVF